MPPHIYGKEDEEFPKPFQYLHPGIRQSTFTSKPQSHVFQQSVTLTASMWDENESQRSMDWSFENWRILGRYSPLLIGLLCGFGIVLLVMSTVMLWRYCLLSATKKVCCGNTYGEITQHRKSLPVRKENLANKIESEYCQNKYSSVGELQYQPTLHRSATVGSMSLHNGSKVENKLLNQGVSTSSISSHNQQTQTPLESLTPGDLYTSHLYLQKLGTSLESPTSLSKSTPALEDLYAKVNFSKKKKNRMRKNEAAIIAMSKSHSGQNNNSLELFGSAVVVYNERTAL